MTLSGSETGVNYQLQRLNTDGTTYSNVGTAVAGTGAALNFGAQSNGTYRVVATNTTTTCSSTFGSATVAATSLPQSFTLGGGVCNTTTGVSGAVTLSGSETGVSYQLQRLNTDGTTYSNVGTAVAGTGAALNFGAQTPGTYRILATGTNPITCSSTFGSLVVTTCVAPCTPPLAYSLSGGTCTNGVRSALVLSGSQTGVSYQLQILNTTTNAYDNVGTAVAGTGSPLSFTATTAGTYRVLATSQGTGTNCTIYCNVVIVPICPPVCTPCITPCIPPLAYSLSGGTCTNGVRSALVLSGSQTGVSYQLQILNTTTNAYDNVGTAVAGTGSPLSFTATTAGTYRVLATSQGTGTNCTIYCNVVIVGECSAANGCTLGYYKNHTGSDSWGCGYTPTTLYTTVFGSTNGLLDPNLTLLGALQLGGGKQFNLARQSVAALLNICSPLVNYSIYEGNIAGFIAAVHNAFSSADAAGAYASILDGYNNTGECPLSGTNTTAGGNHNSDLTSASGIISGTTHGDKLMEIYPNPFTDKASVEFTLVKAQHYTVQLFDMNGRLVSRIATGIADGGKLIRLQIAGHDLPAGIYTLRLTTDSFTQMRRLVMNK
ncbi:hypothetical protein AUC43_17205 [Hymenobacter sedentarius]|uniref:Secretion system C-terminal sorting domain-containing protein n=1 Tax=Hymenobacter sedentarius TaxID=1411621 RepID=A0A0U4C8R0_9BACT|nr:hypothetical protein AUC43_17205 [Hymenobacter sedentarius]